MVRVSEASKKYFLEQALYELRMANHHLKRANGADLLNTQLVCDYLNYKEMIELLIVGVTKMFDGKVEAEEGSIKDPTWRELAEGYIQRNSTNIEALEKRLTSLEWSTAEG